MLSLVLRRKLAITEDVLTAVFFDALAQTGDVELWSAILRTAWPADCDPSIPRFDSFDIRLWPRTQAGEPDAEIVLCRERVEVARVLVEAKLGAQKSGHGELEPDDDVVSPEPTRAPDRDP